MKKLLIAMAALMTLAFAGCEKEAEPASDALTGTTWAGSYGGTPMTLGFNAGGTVSLSMGSQTYTGTYVYNSPDITAQMYIDGRNVTFTGTYSNGTLKISSSEYGQLIFTQTGGQAPDDDSPDADVKLVKQIKFTEIWESEVFTVITKFEYDAQNRVVKISEQNDYEDGEDTYTFSYNGNKLTVHDNADGDEYTVLLNSDGYISSIDDWDFFEYDDNGYLILRYKEDERGRDECTYTWSNGNLMSIAESDYDDSSYTSTIVYDDTLTLVPTNLNLLHTFKIIEHDDYWLTAYGPYGKQCKNLPVRIEHKNSDDTWTDTIDYELNADGSIAKITHKGTYTRGIDICEILYY